MISQKKVQILDRITLHHIEFLSGGQFFSMQRYFETTGILKEKTSQILIFFFAQECRDFNF